MIDFIRGKLVHIAEDYIIVDVGGIGYRAFCPNPYRFPQQEEVTVYTHHHVRDDAILLYGFASREEQSLFRRLIEVSGIGPRVALGIMSGAAPREIAASIEQENIQFLTKLPGIGKKTAQRLILDLKDKIQTLFPALESNDDRMQTAGSTSFVEHSSLTPGWQEAKEALKALGYTDAELDAAWPRIQKLAGGKDDAETWMKLALQQFDRSKQ